MTGSVLLKLMGQGAVYILALESLGDDYDDGIDLMTASSEIEDSFACDTSSSRAITAKLRGQSMLNLKSAFIVGYSIDVMYFRV